MTSCAFITGAARGIGRGLVEDLLARGFRVIATDADISALQETLEQLSKVTKPGQLEGHHLDVTDAASMSAVQENLQNIDVLINNAGLQHVSALEEFPMDRWARLIDVMLTGSARLIRGALPGMRARGHGRIINIGSIHSLVASPFKSAYVAAKHGLVGLSRTLALETADTDITINTICPSYVRTALVENQIAQQARAHNLSPDEVVSRIMLAPMPKRRFVEIEEIGAAVAYLASPAARNVTGQCLVIDGGWTSQ